VWKYFATACAAYLFVQAFVWGGQIYESSAGSSGSGERKSVEQLLAEVVEDQNKQRGKKVDGGFFAGANLYGKTIVFDFTLDKAPTRYDAGQAQERLISQMIPRFCKKRFHPVLREGGAVVFRYGTKSGLSLVDAKVDASVCKVPV
jgi:hypothetical protein